MQREEDSARFVEEEAPDGTVVIYDSQNQHAWIQSTDAVDIQQRA